MSTTSRFMTASSMGSQTHQPSDPRRLGKALVVASLGLLSGVAGATSICRWVDDGGHTQLSEVVPDRYQARATCTDSKRYELSAPQRQAAQQRVAADRARAARAASAAAAPASPSAAAAQGGAASVPNVVKKPAQKRPAEVVTDATDCTTWWRLYDESSACFGPFRTTRGATKAEAFDVCNVIASPEPRCSIRSR